MKSLIFKLLAIVLTLNLMSSCGNKSQKNVLLDENFKNNDLRWIQEKTKYHTLEILDGKYHIDAKDSVNQTSSAPYNRTYLYKLKENFSVTFKINLLERDVDFQSRAGIMLTCPSMDYRVFITNENEIIVTEELYADKEENILLSESLEEDISNSIQELTIGIKGYNGSLKYKGKSIGDFKLKSKSLDGIRIFTTAQSSIDLYHLKVQNI